MTYVTAAIALRLVAALSNVVDVLKSKAIDPAAHVRLDPPDAVPHLLVSLREAGAQDQATALADRLPEAGLFELFGKQEDRHDRFRFGRRADGSPAGPWGWEDLD